MLILGLTGSIAMGKSTTAFFFSEYGIPVFDSDKAVKKFYQSPRIKDIKNIIPQAWINGEFNKQILIDEIEKKPEIITQLELLIHPYVKQEQKKFINEMLIRNERIILLDIPLLYETNSEKNIDIIIVVTANKNIQKKRILDRPNMTEKKYLSLSKRQIIDSKKKEKAHFIIRTDKGMNFAKTQVNEIIKAINHGK